MNIELRADLKSRYGDIFPYEVIEALNTLAVLNEPRKVLMQQRIQRRTKRAETGEKITFLSPESTINGTNIKVNEARSGKFVGSVIPKDLARQWVQGTGPGAKPNTTIAKSIRNVAYALLSGADGWMFDGEDALGQTSTMSLDNQRNLKLAINHDALFLDAAQQVATEMNNWGVDFLGRSIVSNWKSQLSVTTKIFRARGLHLDDRHVKDQEGGFSASIVDVTVYVTNNYKRLKADGSSIVLYLPKIQTAEEAAFWNRILTLLEDFLGLSAGEIKAYVLVEQLEASFQLMEIRAALGLHFVGFNTGRWDYINSVSDAMAWELNFINPNIDVITMNYGYMKNYEDRVRRAVNTPDLNGNYALWQGGMEPNIPVGSSTGVSASMKKAVSGAQREQRAGASGKWVAHWKMVHIVRPVWETAGKENQLGKDFPDLTYTREDEEGLIALEEGPVTVEGARGLLSVALQYGNAFGQGMQAAALKPADSFSDDDVLYLMEDMATGEIRLSILWEWLHKGAIITQDDTATNVFSGDVFSLNLFKRLLEEEYSKLISADAHDVHSESKTTTLPIAYEIVTQYISQKIKMPWYIDLLNLNLNNHDLDMAKDRICAYIDKFSDDKIRITENLDF